MNKLAILAAAAIAATSFGVAGAFAQAGGDFTKADTNSDGKVSLEEAQAVTATLTQDLFTKADANGDGSLDEAEYTNLQALVASPTDSTSSSSAAATDASSSSASSAS